jgi:predicted ATP-grasp superfamily ATP-dependent carboligase
MPTPTASTEAVAPGDGASVIVFGTDSPIGLAVVRDLGRAGYRVTGIGRHANAIGLQSRHCHRAVVRAADPEGVKAQLLALGGTPADCFLIAIGEANINLVNDWRPELSLRMTLLDADSERMALVLDKARTLALARELGIEVPHAWDVDDAAAIDTLAEQVSYPVVLKWSNPHAVIARLREQGLSLRKLEYCQDAAGLRRALHRYDVIGAYPLVQAYCPGHGLGQFFLCRDGEAVLRFQHRRLNEWPP